MIVYIWKDVVDHDSYFLGVKTSKGKYAAWTILPTDAVYELFGKELSAVMEDAQPGTPLPFDLSVDIFIHT